MAGPSSFEADGRFAPGGVAPSRPAYREKLRQKPPHNLAGVFNILEARRQREQLDSEPIDHETIEEDLDVRHPIFLAGGVYYVLEDESIERRKNLSRLPPEEFLTDDPDETTPVQAQGAISDSGHQTPADNVVYLAEKTRLNGASQHPTKKRGRSPQNRGNFRVSGNPGRR